MDSDNGSEKYLRVIIVVLVALILCVGGFFLTVYIIRKDKVKVEEVVVASERKIKLVDKTSIEKIYDYTTSNIASRQETKIYGTFVSADLEQRVIDGEKYVYVIGIKNEDGSLTRVHFKKDEYEAFGGTLPQGSFWVTMPVVITINSLGISLERN